jgi:16S rRNA (uracil1498-N3)-methyltransferase
MRTPRIYVDLELSEGAHLHLPAGPARHLSQVLRLGAGADVVLFNGDGRDYPARLLRGERGASVVSVGPAGPSEPLPPLHIRLALGVSKGERMDFALQKAVELGADEITPLFTERSQVRLSGDRLHKRQDHWRGILIAASEQSGRRRLPRLTAACRLSEFLDVAAAGVGCRLMLDPNAAHALAQRQPPKGAVTLLVGPEGGLDPSERARAAHQGFESVRLGPRILRTETAPLAAIAIIQALWGDLGR